MIIAIKFDGRSSCLLSSGMLRLVALVRTDVSEELSASFIRVTTLAVTSNRRTPKSNTELFLVHRFVSP
jgi:hypothetical protein